jgi:nickel-dependent lactate racemase
VLECSVPYGKGELSFRLPNGVRVERVVPRDVPAADDPVVTVEAVLAEPVGGVHLASFRGARSAAIAINDKTRPVPHQYLLPPLLRRLEELGIPREATRLIIATGAHPPMPAEEYPRVVPEDILARYTVLCHDADDTENMVYRGMTSRGTPVWVNRQFAEADVRIVVGNIEPHQFQGFSGGAKSAAIGLAGHKTINHNHALTTDSRARLGRYASNPARQDVEEIGRALDVHFALNAILNSRNELVHAVASEPRAVMETGIPLSRAICQVTVAAPFDLVIASPGGHPKDINLYQSQKALAHACLVTRDGGAVILVAACPEGTGSRDHEAWMEGMHSYDQVLVRFEREGFRLGPHKFYQIARDASRVRVVLVSDMSPGHVRRLLLTPATEIGEALTIALPDLSALVRVGVLPRASSTIPVLCNGQSAET